MPSTLKPHLRAELATQQVDRGEALVGLVVPERPAIAGGRVLDVGAHAMDRAAGVAIGERSVGADAGDVAVLRAEEAVAGADEAVLDQGAEGDARFCLLARLDLDVLGA